MNWIEVMGPSGIGKSTFLKILKLHKRRNWVTLPEGFQQVALENQSTGLPGTLAKLYVRQSFVGIKKNEVVQYFLNRKEAYLKEAVRYESLISSYLAFQYEASTQSSVEKVYRISLFKKIIENLCVFDFAGYRKLVLFDEGPLNHHPLLDLPQWHQETLLPKGLIFCELDVDTTFERIKHRESQRGRPSPLHRGLSDRALREQIEFKNQKYQKKIELLTSSGIPSLRVDLKEVTQSKIKAVSEFLSRLDKKENE